jgi:hypothetical protein
MKEKKKLCDIPEIVLFLEVKSIEYVRNMSIKWLVTFWSNITSGR